MQILELPGNENPMFFECWTAANENFTKTTWCANMFFTFQILYWFFIVVILPRSILDPLTVSVERTPELQKQFQFKGVALVKDMVRAYMDPSTHMCRFQCLPPWAPS